MDELNDLIAAMPDGSTLTLEPGARYEISGPIKITHKRDFRLVLNGAAVAGPRGLVVDFTGSRDCGVDCADPVPGRPEA